MNYYLSILTENNPGVLGRIAGLLRRKLFNIVSLTVGPTEDPHWSRFTVVIHGPEDSALKAAKVIERLIEVKEVQTLALSDVVVREIALITVGGQFSAENFSTLVKGSVRVVESSTTQTQLEIITHQAQDLDQFLATIRSNYSIIQVVRSGLIAAPKGV